MICNVDLIELNNSELGIQKIKFTFILESDDVNLSYNFPSNSTEIELINDSVEYYLPFLIDMPHPDLLAYVALNLVYPFIGNNFKINSGVSKSFSEQIKSYYKNIATINVNDDIFPFSLNEYENSSISFSSGVDSIAASIIDEEDSYLLLMADIDQNKKIISKRHIDILEMMDKKKKFAILTNQTSLVKNHKNGGKVPAGNYSYMNHIILVSDHLRIKNIFTGDIIGNGWTGLFTEYKTKYGYDRFWNTWKFIGELGLYVDSATKWITELTTAKIVSDKYGTNESFASCTLIKAGVECNNCFKCFRKLLIKIHNNGLLDNDLSLLNNSRFLVNWNNLDNNDLNKWKFYPILKVSADKISTYNLKLKKHYPQLNQFVEFFRFDDYDYSYLTKIDRHSLYNVDLSIKKTVDAIQRYAEMASESDLENFKRLNWKKLLDKKLSISGSGVVRKRMRINTWRWIKDLSKLNLFN